MFSKRLLIKTIKENLITKHTKYKTYLHTTRIFYSEEDSKKIMIPSSFETIDNKTKNAYLDMVDIFISRDVNRRGHVEFIYSALKNMEHFNVHKDLEVYKALVDVLPKGKFIPQNIIQAEFMHYPKQQQCVIDLLEQMEENGVMPDYELEDMLLNIFGKRGFPLRKFWRMMYWMPKFKNLSPWPVPNPPPNEALELAKLAIARITTIDVKSSTAIYQTADITNSIEDTWIVSSQSPKQKKLLQEHHIKDAIYVEGSFRVWLRDKSVNYFILRSNSKLTPQLEKEDSDDVSTIITPMFNTIPKQKTLALLPSVHEQEDGIIFSVCATGTSSKDSLLSWIRHLEKENPILTDSTIVFCLRSAETQISTVELKNKANESIVQG